MLDDISPLDTAISIVRQKSYPPISRMNGLLYMIEKFEESACIPVFEEVLCDTTENTEVRSAAALALGKVGGERAYTLLSNLGTGCDISIKGYVLHALGLLGREESLPILLAALQDKDNNVFASAAEALGKLGTKAIPSLVELLADTNQPDDSRCVAAWQLGNIKSQEAISPLLDIVQHESNLDVTALAIWALGEIGVAEPAVQEVLLKAKQHDDPSISERADLAIKKNSRHIN